MKKQKVFKAPENISIRDRNLPSVFLAGTIDTGNSIDWQTDLTKQLKLNSNIFNPRRDGWDDSWETTINSPQFNEQVNWELDALEESDIIAMYFADGSKSPISLLELGLFANQNTWADGPKLVVYCNDFYRKGNVDIVCQRYNIPVFTNYETWVQEIKRKLKKIRCVYSD